MDKPTRRSGDWNIKVPGVVVRMVWVGVMGGAETGSGN
jgi:hypothetical protein